MLLLVFQTSCFLCTEVTFFICIPEIGRLNIFYLINKYIGSSCCLGVVVYMLKCVQRVLFRHEKKKTEMGRI